MSKDVVLLDSFVTFGDLLKYLRIRAHLKQRDLAIAVGYSEAQISRQESNKRVPSEYALKALFVPALYLEDEPETIAKLLQLAEKARNSDYPLAVIVAEEPVSPQISESPARHNLPRLLTSFIGREREVAHLVELVREYPLVTITGTGGVGKTRLALKAANGFVEDFPDGVWLVELVRIIDPVFVPIAVASIFNVQSAPGQRLVQTLLNHIATKRMLLIFDNCEHVIDAVADLSTSLLQGCPNLSILATSREILNVEGEFFFRCPSLSLPETLTEYASLPLLKRAEASEAVQLFLHRAVAASPGFQLTETNAAAVAEICRRLDGIPLAIELAAARLRLLSLDQIASSMDDIFGLISGGGRSAQPRHKTLRALIEWSYQLLSPAEQILLRRLSVFAGGWTLAAAEAVASGDGVEPGEVLDRMQQLADKSLVVVETTEFEENRYRMLETIRQYASEKIHEAGEYRAIRDRHLAFVAWMAEQAHPLDPMFVLSHRDRYRMMQEIDNVRLALAWSLETDILQGLLICLAFNSVAPFHLNLEIAAWMERLLEADAAGSGTPGINRCTPQKNLLRGIALTHIGETSYLWGRWSRAEHALLESISILETIGAQAEYFMAAARMHLGCLLICTDPQQSKLYLESSRDTFWRLDVKPSIPGCDRISAALYLFTGDLLQAGKMVEEDLSLSKALWGKESSSAIEYAGLYAWLSGEFDRAINYFHQALDRGVELRGIPQAAYGGLLEGCAALAKGSMDHTLRVREKLLVLGHQTDLITCFFHADALLARLEWIQGRWDQAARLSEEGLARYYPSQLSFTVSFPYVQGRVALARGELNRAELYFRQMDDMANAPPVWWWKAIGLHVFGLFSAARASQRSDMAERAAILFGAQEKLFAWLPNVLSPFERDEYARALTIVKERLSAEGFRAAWEKGQAMTHQQAFALALEETGMNLV